MDEINMASQTNIQSSIGYSLIFVDNGKLNYQRPFFDALVCFLFCIILKVEATKRVIRSCQSR